jgi:DNA-binding protein HU-beta
MNKQDLIEVVAADVGMSKAEAGKVVDSVFGHIKGAVAGDGKASFVGFGTFSAKARAARTGRNPKTGEQIQIPAKTVVHFSPGQAFEDALPAPAKAKKK